MQMRYVYENVYMYGVAKMGGYTYYICAYARVRSNLGLVLHAWMHTPA